MSTTSTLPAGLVQSTPRKRGRPQADYRRADGTKIDGLSRQKDRRWRISATGEVFFEPDELRAIARFEAIMDKLRGENMVKLPLQATSLDAAMKAAQAAGATKLHMKIRPNDQPTEYSVKIGSAEFYAAVAQMLSDDPRELSLKTGVEWVARGAELPRPTPSPKLAGLGDVYADKPGLSTNEAGRSRTFWKEFVDAVGVATVRELTHERVAAYEAKVRGGTLAPKSILHRYRKIRTIFAHAIKRGIGVEDSRRALDILAMLEVKDHTPLDPQPIEVKQFHAIHKAAIKAGDKTFAAMMLMSLNAALYPGEAAALSWDDVDLAGGHLVTRRPKTGVSRIAVLWPETIAALKSLPRLGDHIFYTRIRSYTVFSALDSWRKYREAAELPAELKFSQIRDSAYSIALTVSLEQAKLLAGHRFAGSADHYIRRNPTLVADACAAIHAAFAPFASRRTKRRQLETVITN